MGINKSGITDPDMGIRGGHVIITEEGLVIDDGIQPEGLQHPPAPITTNDIAIPTTGEVEPRELNTIYTETRPVAFLRWLIHEGGIIHVGTGICTVLAATTAAYIWWWFVTMWETIVSTIIQVTIDVGVALTVVVALVYLFGGRSGGGYIDVKGCPRGGTPGRIRLWND